MSDPIVRLGHADDFVELRCLEYGQAPGVSEGDLRLAVSVRQDDFAGAYDQVWVGRDEWASFIEALTRLERERQGTASLVAMSPGEFKLQKTWMEQREHRRKKTE